MRKVKITHDRSSYEIEVCETSPIILAVREAVRNIENIDSGIEYSFYAQEGRKQVLVDSISTLRGRPELILKRRIVSKKPSLLVFRTPTGTKRGRFEPTTTLGDILRELDIPLKTESGSIRVSYGGHLHPVDMLDEISVADISTESTMMCFVEYIQAETEVEIDAEHVQLKEEVEEKTVVGEESIMEKVETPNIETHPVENESPVEEMEPINEPSLEFRPFPSEEPRKTAKKSRGLMGALKAVRETKMEEVLEEPSVEHEKEEEPKERFWGRPATTGGARVVKKTINKEEEEQKQLRREEMSIYLGILEREQTKKQMLQKFLTAEQRERLMKAHIKEYDTCVIDVVCTATNEHAYITLDSNSSTRVIADMLEEQAGILLTENVSLRTMLGPLDMNISLKEADLVPAGRVLLTGEVSFSSAFLEEHSSFTFPEARE
ncbi:hypothetical protein PCE1_000130 [Barthelona sp. PCE]